MRNNRFRRFLAIFMIGTVMLAFTGCKDSDSAKEEKAEAKAVSEEKQDTDKEKAKKDKKEDKEDKEKTQKKEEKKKENDKTSSDNTNTGTGSGGSSGNSGGGSDNSSQEESLSSIMASIVAGVDLPQVGNITLNGDNFPAYAFIARQDGFKGLASEAMVGSIAHSVVLVRVPEGASARSAAASIKANADPRKWICVEAEKTVVKYHKRTILLVMSDTETANAIAANFDALY